MPKTANDLATASIIDLTRARTAQADDVARVTGRIEPLFADLKTRRVIASAVSPEAIPDALFPDLVRLFAEIIAPNFGREANAETVLGMEARLREIARLDRSSSSSVLVRRVLAQIEIFGQGRNVLDATEVAERVPEILEGLSARNVIYIDDPADVQPAAAVPDLARYIAASLASPTRYDEMQLAETQLRRLKPVSAISPPLRADYW